MVDAAWWIAASTLVCVVCAPSKDDVWTNARADAASGASSTADAAPEQKGAADERKIPPPDEPPAYVDVVAWSSPALAQRSAGCCSQHAT